jgi:hypothetical protein
VRFGNDRTKRHDFTISRPRQRRHEKRPSPAEVTLG